MKLNLGCGYDKRGGFINADSFAGCDPDLCMDIEETPWPFAEGQFEYVLIKHVLEHVGETRARFFAVLRELYRVCSPDARVEIHVPHYLHLTYHSDPTHLRPITALTLRMLSKARNRAWVAARANYSMLALMLDVDFELERAVQIYDPAWLARRERGEISSDELRELAGRHPGVVRELQFVVRVVKP